MDTIFQNSYKALKPGGIFGVVEHRAKDGTSLDVMKKSGYVTEDYAISIAKKHGFELAAKSEINANPKDTADHPVGNIPEERVIGIPGTMHHLFVDDPLSVIDALKKLIGED